ncbi:BREX system Lon protease-like protein BrxL [Shimia thalassica]|uniref:BREX system Lon protease-like protein BrxL n=1 Tax=Shimia thalassica TaxID=1715693 RepID=UPI0026E3EAB6|nr:BREX system Lon protease-like protein BrxL [Shimia thalassica]MDO6479834.1 BREX system Lon protease-like protein BrxL [Shimia thalassica]
MTALDDKINEKFAGFVVRKDLVKAVKGNAIVPGYVLEYLLGQYCATDDEASIATGIETVKEILRKHYVHRNQAGLVQSEIKERGRFKVIDRVMVSLNEKTDAYEAVFENLSIKNVAIDSGTIKAHPKLLVTGVWCISDVSYEFAEKAGVSPWTVDTLKPIQVAGVDFEMFKEARAEFTTDEWIDVLMQSVGFNPEEFGPRSKLLQLMRLIPFVERNYNLIELGPKGTGKSHIYSEFSPHGQLISGGEVTVPKLFVNNSNGKIGLVGYWDVVAFDEFAGRTKKPQKALVDIMKNYMANKSFSRGVSTMGAEASFAFVGNTAHNVPYMLKNSDLFEELPAEFHDSAFIDRIHAYLPGWEIEVIRSELFSDGYGFIVDYLAEILRYLRNDDFALVYQDAGFKLGSQISTRDRDAINKTMSGYLKLLFPNGGAKEAEIEGLLTLAIESRKRVKDQLKRIDSTYPETDFHFVRPNGEKCSVTTLEEDEYPKFYNRNLVQDDADEEDVPLIDAEDAGGVNSMAASEKPASEEAAKEPAEMQAREGHIVVKENMKGVSFEKIFGPWIKGATKITITDPYIRLFHQARNLMEFLELVIRQKNPEDHIAIELVTAPNDGDIAKQREFLDEIVGSCSTAGIDFTWKFDDTGTAHARHIITDTGWKISLDRGLDIFQHFGTSAFSLAGRFQEHRAVKQFEVTYLKLD